MSSSSSNSLPADILPPSYSYSYSNSNSNSNPNTPFNESYEMNVVESNTTEGQPTIAIVPHPSPNPPLPAAVPSPIPVIDSDGIITQIEVFLPSLVRGYHRLRNDFCFPNVDEAYFPAELSIDWNVLHGAPISSGNGVSISVPAVGYGYGNGHGHGRGFQPRINNPYSNPSSPMYDPSIIYVAPPDAGLLGFFTSHPTRVIRGLQFLTLLQYFFSQRISLISQEFRNMERLWRFFVWLGTVLTVIPTALLLNEQTSRVNIIYGLLIGLGILMLLSGIWIQKSKIVRMFAAATKSGPIIVCGHCNELQQRNNRIEGEERTFHGLINFRRDGNFIFAKFEISWKKCDQQCILNQISQELRQIILNRSIPAQNVSMYPQQIR